MLLPAQQQTETCIPVSPNLQEIYEIKSQNMWTYIYMDKDKGGGGGGVASEALKTCLSNPVKDMREQEVECGSGKWGDAETVCNVWYNVLRFNEGTLGDEDIITDQWTNRTMSE